jgi:cytochrome c biogenesis protein CcmG/thiol:disulfide interchange protein DsbE
MKRLLPALLLPILVAGCTTEPAPSAGGTEASPAAPAVNPAPDFKVEKLAETGKFVSKKDFEGKVVLLEFWATWCGPCHVLAPVIQDLHNKYKDKGFEVVSVSDEDRATLAEFVKKREQTYPIYQDFLGNASQAYDVEGYPTFFLLDRRGNLILKDPANLKEVDEAIQKAL